MFIVLHLTMVHRGFEEGSKKFYNQFADLFRSTQNEQNEDLNLLKSVRTLADLNSSLEYEKYLKNIIQIKLSFHANEILMQFLKFENIILLLQMINNYFEFKISKEKNIIDLVIATKLAKHKQCKYPKLESTILIPFDQSAQKGDDDENQQDKSKIQKAEAGGNEVQDELVLGRLAEFCPEAIIH